MQLYCLPSAYLNIKLCFTKYLSSQITQWEGCACGDSQRTFFGCKFAACFLTGNYDLVSDNFASADSPGQGLSHVKN